MHVHMTREDADRNGQTGLFSCEVMCAYFHAFAVKMRLVKRFLTTADGKAVF